MSSPAVLLATLFEAARERADRTRLHWYAWQEQHAAAWEVFEEAERTLRDVRAADRPYSDGGARVRAARRTEEAAWEHLGRTTAEMLAASSAWREAAKAARDALDALIAHHHPEED